MLDLGLIVPRLAGNYFGFPMHWSGTRDLGEQSLNAYEVGYTANIAGGRASRGTAFYINDSKQSSRPKKAAHRPDEVRNELAEDHRAEGKVLSGMRQGYNSAALGISHSLTRIMFA